MVLSRHAATFAPERVALALAVRPRRGDSGNAGGLQRTVQRADADAAGKRMRSRCVIGLDAIRFNKRGEYNLYFGAV